MSALRPIDIPYRKQGRAFPWLKRRVSISLYADVTGTVPGDEHEFGQEYDMPKIINWSFDAATRLHRAAYDDGHELLVGDRRDGGYDAFVVDIRSSDTVWNSDICYTTVASAKRGAGAAAKRLLKEVDDAVEVPVSTDSVTACAVVDAETLADADVETDIVLPSPLWESRDGYHMATIQRGQQAARCSIVQIDPDHVLGFIRLRDLTLRIEFGGLMEARQALGKRATGLLEQLVPEGMYAGGL